MRIRLAPIFSLGGRTAPLAWLSVNAAPATKPAAQAGFGLKDRGAHPFAFNDHLAELLEWEEAETYRASWLDLTRRALEPNVFLDPAFALSAVQHLPIAQRPAFLFVWGSGARDNPSDLIGLFALSLPQPGRGHMARIWCTEMMTSGLPLLDRERAYQAVQTMHQYVAARHSHVRSIIIPQMPIEGATRDVFDRHAGIHALPTHVFDRRTRAVASSEVNADEFMSHHVSSRKRKELRRQQRRLEELGELKYTSARSSGEVRNAMERFLTLEASGWKGRKTTALLSDPSTATFARTMARYFAQDGKCSIDALELNGRPIAMGIVLCSNDTAFFWKTAYDEAYAKYSPGVLFSVEMTRRMIANGAHNLINSCAIPDHPMIDHIWRERIVMGEYCTATLNARAKYFASMVSRETSRRRLRGAVKRAYYALLGRRPS